MKAFNNPDSPENMKLLNTGRILGVSEFSLVLLLLALPLFSILSLPLQVPVHFNATGQPDGYGSRWLLLIVPVSGSLLYAFIRWIETMKNYINYPIKISASNRQIQEQLISGLIYQYRFITLVIFNILTILIIISAGNNHVRGFWLIAVLIFIAYLLPLPLYIRKANKFK